jgi:hypothetical protein
MLNDNLKYDFPIGNKDPFENDNSDGNYFVYANAHSNLGKELDEFSIDILSQNIPMGYKTIIVCQRVLMIFDGKIIQDWDINKDLVNNFSGEYLITTNKPYDIYVKDWGKYKETTTIYKPTSEGLPWTSSFNNFKESLDVGISESIDKKCKILISIIIDSISWH